MDKPTVFFSHSSIDRDYISELQKGVNSRTSGTVNIFQSSDGESIPFGNNWVHQIEENLHKAKIMFVLSLLNRCRQVGSILNQVLLTLKV